MQTNAVPEAEGNGRTAIAAAAERHANAVTDVARLEPGTVEILVETVNPNVEKQDQKGSSRWKIHHK